MKPSRKVPEGALSVTYWANSDPGAMSTPMVASPFAGTVTAAPSPAPDAAPLYDTATPRPRQSEECSVKNPPSTISDRAWELSS